MTQTSSTDTAASIKDALDALTDRDLEKVAQVLGIDAETPDGPDAWERFSVLSGHIQERVGNRAWNLALAGLVQVGVRSVLDSRESVRS